MGLDQLVAYDELDIDGKRLEVKLVAACVYMCIERGRGGQSDGSKKEERELDLLSSKSFFWFRM